MPVESTALNFSEERAENFPHNVSGSASLSGRHCNSKVINAVNLKRDTRDNILDNSVRRNVPLNAGANGLNAFRGRTCILWAQLSGQQVAHETLSDVSPVHYISVD